MTDTDLGGSSQTFFQAFRAAGEKEHILIPAVQHPITNDLYVLWSDITDCFPGMIRIQYHNVYVPKLRGDDLYRIKPFGIRYHSGLVLDIIYEKKLLPVNKRNDNRSIGKLEDHPAWPKPCQDVVADMKPSQGAGVVANTDALDEAGKGDGGDPDEGEVQIGDVEQESSDAEDGYGYSDFTEYSDDFSEYSDEFESEEGEMEEEEEETPSSIRELPADHIPQEKPLRVESLVRHRVRGIFKARYTWSELRGHSKLFCFLPILEEDVPSGENEAPQVPLTTKTATEIFQNTGFEFYFLCDCGGIPGAKERASPHWVDKNGKQKHSMPSAEDLSQQQMRQILPFVGEYVMGVLEMLKYGVFLDRMPLSGHEHLLRAIKYLESKGFRSSASLLAEMNSKSAGAIVTRAMLDEVEPIAVLEEKVFATLKSVLVRGPYDDYASLYPFKTSAGDIRWMCGRHWYNMWPDKEMYTSAFAFRKDPMSSEGWYDSLFGVWSSRIKSMKRARRYFELAEKMTWNPVFTVWLDWDLSLEHEEELAQAVSRLSAAAVHILVRPREGTQEEANAGFSCGYLRLTAAAIRKLDIESFTLTKQEDKADYDLESTETPAMLRMYSPLSRDYVALVERAAKGGKMKATLMASNVDTAIQTVRRHATGLHHFLELRFGLASYLFADNLTIKVAETIKEIGEERGAEEDMDFFSGDAQSLFHRRQGRDEFSIVSGSQCDRGNFFAGFLNEARFEVSFERDKDFIRNLLTLNTRLKLLVLGSKELDYDPSQVFENYKEELADHPSIETLTIQPGLFVGRKSTFTWRGLQDPDKLGIDIVCDKADHTDMMFQRHGFLIERLELEGLSLADAAAMDKAVRRKKRPLALKYLSVKDVHLMEPAVRLILREIIVKGAIEDVVVQGSVLRQAAPSQPGGGGKKEASMTPAKLEANVKVWAEFLVAIRSKVTELVVQDDPQRRFLRAMELQPVLLPEMPRLGTFHLTCMTPAGSSIFDRAWLETLLEFKGPAPEDIDQPDEDSSRVQAKEIFIKRSQMTDLRAITDFRLHEVAMDPEDWDGLLLYMDFTQVVKFEVRQTNTMSRETLLEIADSVPKDSAVLKHFVVSDGTIVDDDTVIALEEKFGSKIVNTEGGALISLNGFVV
ncbi:hypothetical protein BGZ47_004874 [Haplosporangium gracile]|nr:hypothetical protein BGZ47_004874 [Haplosporangium gracile]